MMAIMRTRIIVMTSDRGLVFTGMCEYTLLLSMVLVLLPRGLYERMLKAIEGESESEKQDCAWLAIFGKALRALFRALILPSWIKVD